MPTNASRRPDPLDYLAGIVAAAYLRGGSVLEIAAAYSVPVQFVHWAVDAHRRNARAGR